MCLAITCSLATGGDKAETPWVRALSLSGLQRDALALHLSSPSVHLAFSPTVSQQHRSSLCEYHIHLLLCFTLPACDYLEESLLETASGQRRLNYLYPNL